MKRKSTKYLAALLICLCVLLNNGCFKIYFYEDYPLKVVDAESNQPIEGALVRVDYFMPGGGFFIPNSPKEMTVRTDVNGKVKLKYANNPGMWVWYYGIEAEGYMRFISYLDRYHTFNQVNKSEYVASLYSKPDPRIEIIVPDNYQGPVAIEFVKTNDVNQSEPGQRLFSYHIQQDGYLAIETLPLFVPSELIHKVSYHMHPDVSENTVSVKRENGSKIKRIGGQYEQVMESSGQEPEIEPDSIIFRYVWSEGSKILYLIGTEHDKEVMYNKMFPKERIGWDRNVFNSYFKPEKVQ